MRRPALALAALLTLSGVAARAETPSATNLSVVAGQASYVSLSAPVRDLVMGDPTVADVSVINERTLVVLGKHPGVTSLIAFGASGQALTNRQIVVSETGAGAVTVYRGAAASVNYACGAQCSRLTPAATTTVP